MPAVVGYVRQATGVGEQSAEGDFVLPVVPEHELRDPGADRGVQVEAELQDARGHERIAHRGTVEQRLGGHRGARPDVPHPPTARRHFVAPDNRHGQPGHVEDRGELVEEWPQVVRHSTGQGR